MQRSSQIITTNKPTPNLFYGLDALNGVGTNFGVGVGDARPEGPTAGNEVLGEETASPSPPTRGFAGALYALSAGSGAEGFLVF